MPDHPHSAKLDDGFFEAPVVSPARDIRPRRVERALVELIILACEISSLEFHLVQAAAGAR